MLERVLLFGLVETLPVLELLEEERFDSNSEMIEDARELEVASVPVVVDSQPKKKKRKTIPSDVTLLHQRIVGSNRKFLMHLSFEDRIDAQITVLQVGLTALERAFVEKCDIGKTNSQGSIDVTKCSFEDSLKLSINFELKEEPIGSLMVFAGSNNENNNET